MSITPAVITVKGVTFLRFFVKFQVQSVEISDKMMGKVIHVHFYGGFL